jgi:hypothetical protein
VSHHSPNFSRNKGRSRGNWHPNSNRYTPQNRGQSAANWQPNHWQQTRRNSGTRQWSGQQHVRCQLCSSFGHTAPHCSQLRSSPLLTLLLGMFLLRLGSPTPAQINTSHLILDL